jgi:Ca-activated chloride channel family protein
LLAAALTAVAPAALAQTSDLAKPTSSVEIVLEASKGMQVAGAKKAIVRAARSLPEGTPLGLRVYGAKAAKGSAACADSQGLVPVAPVDPAAIAKALRPVKPVGARSPVALALTRAAKDMPPAGARTLILIGGHADDCSPPPDCQTVTGSRQPLRVDTIGLAIDPAGRRDLQCTARRSGGVYADAADGRALEPVLEAALARATRDRRSLGAPLAGALDESQGTTAKPGAYVDSIAPDTERWYHVPVPPGQVLSASATLVAPPTGDMSAPGSSLTLDAFGAGQASGTVAGSGATSTATNLFAFDPSKTITISVTARPTQAGNSVRVALHDSPDKQLAQKLGDRSLPVELLFRLSPAGAPHPKPPAAASTSTGTSAHDVSWPAAIGGLVACALIVFAALALVRPRRKEEA